MVTGESVHPLHHKTTRRWFRFGLRTMLLGVALLAVFLTIPVNRATRQRYAVEAIQQLGGIPNYDFHKTDATEPSAPQWLRHLIGDDYFRRVIAVSFDNSPISDAELQHLKGLPPLESLLLRNCLGITDKGLVQLDGMTTLQYLDLTGTSITDAGLVHIERFTTCGSTTPKSPMRVYYTLEV